MKIDSKLNLVLPIEREDGTKVYVHSMPISMEVFETYHFVISKTFTKIYNSGMMLQGPRIAAMTLKEEAEKLGAWDSREGFVGVEKGLVAEISRLTNVVAMTSTGWGTIPLYEALQKGIFDEDELSEVKNAITFFTVAYRMHKKSERATILQSACRLWDAQILSSGLTEFVASLPTLTAAENTTAGPDAIQSSVPS